MVVMCLAVLFSAGEARAQYRNNGLFFEGGTQSFEFAPYTVGAFALSRGVYEGWGQLAKSGGPARPKQVKPCADLKPYGFPCVNNWFGITDGVYLGGGYQRVLGDLLLDLTESPIVRNIVFTYRALLGASLTLSGGGHTAPVFIVHQEGSVRWNIMDERIRPYVGVGGGFNLFVDPFGLAGRVNANNAACARNENTASLNPNAGTGCTNTTFGTNNINPNAALFYITSFPVMLSLPRAEAGLEYFFAEDMSVQGYLSAATYGTILPQFILRPPFVGLSTRAGANAVFYF